jgi:hypothetical protein
VGKSERHVHFDVDRIRIDAEDSSAAKHGEHRAIWTARDGAFGVSEVSLAFYADR